MKHVIRRIAAQLTESGALTHMLPLETRIDAQRAARRAASRLAPGLR